MDEKAGFEFVKEILLAYMKQYEPALQVEIEEFHISADWQQLNIIGREWDSTIKEKIYCGLNYNWKKGSCEIFPLHVVSEYAPEIYREFPEEKERGRVCLAEEYRDALVDMQEEMDERNEDEDLPWTDIIAEPDENGNPVFKLVGFPDPVLYYMGCFEPEGSTFENLQELFIKREEHYFANDLFFLAEQLSDAEIMIKAKVTSYWYQAEEQVEELDREPLCIRDFTAELWEKHKKVTEDMEKKISMERYGMELEKVDELAGCLAMEYYMSSGGKCPYREDELAEYKSQKETYYEALHKQESLEAYAKVLSLLLRYLPKDLVQRAFEELKKNPDRRGMEILHSVCKSRYRTEKPEARFSGQLYREGQIYLAFVTKETLQGSARYDGEVFLLSEQLQYKRGKELLSQTSFDEFSFRKGDREVLAEWRKSFDEPERYPVAVLKENTYIDEECIRRQHGWKDDIIPVEVIGRAPNGRLQVKYYEPRKLTVSEYCKLWEGQVL